MEEEDLRPLPVASLLELRRLLISVYAAPDLHSDDDRLSYVLDVVNDELSGAQEPVLERSRTLVEAELRRRGDEAAGR